MCGVCGCGDNQVKSYQNYSYSHFDQHKALHTHVAVLSPDMALHTHVSMLTPTRMVQIEQDILTENNHYAAKNRQFFDQQGVLALNLVSSPGSGKTTLLVETIKCLKDDVSMTVIEGDQQTDRDADRIRATGVVALQINTGKGCHLDAHRVGHAIETLPLGKHSVLFIENVGNLVCPAAFDLGEAHKVVVLSVTEGEDKPLKYPDMFYAANMMILNKIDLLPYLDFDVAQCIQYAKQVNPQIKILLLSVKNGEGMDEWLHWIKAELAQQRTQ